MFKYKTEILQFGVENVSFKKGGATILVTSISISPLKEKSKYLSKVPFVDCDLFLYDK